METRLTPKLTTNPHFLDRLPLSKLSFYATLVVLGLVLFVANNLGSVATLLQPRPGYVPLFMPRNPDSAQYLTWLEANKSAWTIPDYNAPWLTEAALRVPLMWIPATISRLTDTPSIYAYLGFEAACYVLGIYALAFMLDVFTTGYRQSFFAVVVMICTVPLRSYTLLFGLLFKSRAWVLQHSGYVEFLGGPASDGFFQGASCGASITAGTAGALFSLALLGRYLRFRKPRYLWQASLAISLAGFLHPFEFIPVTAAGCVALLRTVRDQRSSVRDLLILCLPAFAVVLFYYVPTLTHPWLKVATDLNRLHSIRLTHHEFMALGLPVYIGVGFALCKPTIGLPTDWLLGSYVLIASFALNMPFLPWPQHFKDGLDCAAAVFVVRMLGQVPGLVKLWERRTLWCAGVVLLLFVGGIAPHVYFRYLTYQFGGTAKGDLSETAVAPVDEVQVIKWLRAHAPSDQLILAPLENAPWMATVPIHSFASHWIFSLTLDEQNALDMAFFHGSLSDAKSDLFLTSYGVRYVLVPIGSPALRYVAKAELRWTGQKLQLYEFSQNQMRSFPKLQKLSPGRYSWNLK
jgi:hypothetical protein